VDQGGTKSGVWKQGAGDSSWTEEGQSQVFGNRMLGTVGGPRRDKVSVCVCIRQRNEKLRFIHCKSFIIAR
jgi:hypothetical protein